MASREEDLLQALYASALKDRYKGVEIKKLKAELGADFDRAYQLLLAKGDIDRQSPVNSARLSDGGFLRADKLFGD